MTMPQAHVNSIALSAKVAAGSISKIDQQIATINGIKIPSVSVSNINADFAQTKKDTKQWSAVKSTISVAFGELTNSQKDLSSALGSKDFEILKIFTQVLAKDLASTSQLMKKAQTSVAKFHQLMGADISKLNGDRATIRNEIQAKQNQIHGLEQQIQDQVNKINYYKDHPWKLILAGLSIVGLIEILDNMNSSMKAAQKEEKQIQQIQQNLQPLINATGPINMLIPAISSLGLGLTSLNTAMQESSNALSQVLTLEGNSSTIKPVLIAELKTIQQQLSQAAKIANQILK